ncbi:hypothetical protein [Rhodothermus profundi]|uniref:Vitamin K-dependent gamma-carboxylase n=1 Tax=Rhodothermus profundi TaxID=633813 RepID=A0A1M6RCA5_9BACT|nr:hypothetical protein [Rhodothermus profundi]SHK30125.1 hypothetical protein SAMN04488087_0788 [Rhodothermus profundi]
MKFFLRDLFDFERPETAGERLFFALFEGFVVFTLSGHAWSWALYLGRLETPLYPTGLAHYLDVSWFMQPSVALGLAATVTVLLLLGLTHRWRLAYLLALVGLHLLYVSRFSLGKTPHGTHLLGLTLLSLALGALLFRSASYRRRAALGFTYFFVGLSYTLAGLSKLVATGPGWVDGSHLTLWILEKGVDLTARTGAWEPSFLQQLLLAHPSLSTLLLTSALLLELLAFTVWWRPFRFPVLLALVGMHAGIYATLTISFHFAAAELLLLALPWSRWLDRLLQTRWASRIRWVLARRTQWCNS